MPEYILAVNIVQPHHCNVCGLLATTEVEFGVKYDENNSRTQSFRFCDDCSKKLVKLIVSTNKQKNNLFKKKLKLFKRKIVTK